MAAGVFGAPGHRARQHSQGFFEPSLPNTNPTGLTASQIAAQAAMHTISPPPLQGERKRSIQELAQINTSYFNVRKPSDTQSPQVASAGPLGYSNGLIGGSRLAATTAANVAFPHTRSITPSPTGLRPHAVPMPPPPPPQLPSKEAKGKSSKMKLFSKPKTMTLSRDKEVSSPGKGVIGAHVYRSGLANTSSTSLLEPSSATSFYSSANASTSTLVPTPTIEKDKDKHRHNFLSRSKHKLKDDQASLPLSSANSNSLAVNPDRPQPLYSFTPDSPSTTSFAKTMSSFDLRHGGRALREKKKEEKAAAAAAAKFEAASIYANSSYTDKNEPFSFNSTADIAFGPGSATTLTAGHSFPFAESTTPSVSAAAVSNIGSLMGVPGLGPDDVWPLLKARLLNLFSGEPLVRPVEELNILVSSHVERCVRRKLPLVLIEDLRELLITGFSSLAQLIRGAPDDRLVTKLVDIWTNVYGAIVPFLQAVFLPLDLEFKGKGAYMTTAQAQEFWSAMPEGYKSDDRPTSSGSTATMPRLGDELDVRRITLIAFRDTIILPKHEILMTIFSRLSLGSINAAASPNLDGGRSHSRSDPLHPGADRPDTAGSLSPHMSSYNSQSSTLLDASSTSSGGRSMGLAGRSRATSNTSAGSFGTDLPHLSASMPPQLQPMPSTQLPPIDPAKVTDTVAKMLQCLYVLASCQTGDVGQGVVERLTGALKYNWLGRGRTGRDRRGWVGVKSQRVGLVGA
ncbi:hypothetical protein AMS68_003395 [Peltaster fructicola]|uniref:HbrB-like protein n=1 Tax=Peltaster fructicola TaxID=286661 RepID=A0A6H0XTD5_9PEZI|nr:hypothetical protein AMS68_003395 [Peltaster fructicola]